MDLWVQLPGSRWDLNVKKNVTAMRLAFGSELPVPGRMRWVFGVFVSLVSSR